LYLHSKGDSAKFTHMHIHYVSSSEQTPLLPILMDFRSPPLL
jgi:hypothetical protein